MISFIHILLCAIAGGTLGAMDIDIYNWRFWVILVCMLGSNICGYISGMKNRT